ncbi:flagellar hook assembly protein FlgD [Marinagarivorans cellulosilyticus]|uniref:Basal-body rod modification protein FlgD n=1 Tax=Marinagarivorans cellulosilyticus TaxID=2721545 RepID=A0AAN2BLP5_9GAMM|nr:flagellar hook assembly protein FlgD [Marinagarivorans cellulosilyticus]BCD99304.1 flagellar basal-body rod modification protein FlgD [Marinagarivorans cellulosilyticus]
MTVSAVGQSSAIDELGIANKTKDDPKSGELGQKAFLKLMITQMENQDPLSPQENTEFIAQLAQFSSVEALDSMNNKFDNLTENFVANQALQASSLVGRSVAVPSEIAQLDPNNVVAASVDIPASTQDVSVKIYSEGGALLDQANIGAHSAGEMVVRWNGQQLEVNGTVMDWESSAEGGQPAGIYRIEFEASIDGEPTQLEAALSANVNSVTVGKDGMLTLNLAGIGPVKMSDVKQFN